MLAYALKEKIVDYKQIVTWIVPVVIRGLAWILAAKLGLAASEASSYATSAGEALGALALVGLSVWSSVAGRKKLLNTEPPK